MNFVLRTARKDLLHHWRDPYKLLIWLGIPLLIGGLITMASGGKEGPKPQAHLLVADHDDSFISRFFVGVLNQDAVGEFVRGESVTEEEGRARMADGDASALLIIPKGFGQALLEEKPVVLSLMTNPAQSILPNMVEEALSILVEGAFYLHRVAGDDLRLLAQGSLDGAGTVSDLAVAEMSVRFKRVGEALADYLEPLRIQFATGDPPSDEPAKPGAEASAPKEEPVPIGVLFLPGILFMSLLFMGQGLSDNLWHERMQHTLRRVAVSPQSMRSFYLGKLLAGAALIGAVSLVALLVGTAYLELPFSSLPLAWIWSVFSGVILTQMLMQVHLLAGSQRGANILSLAIIFPLMMLGGSFFPFESMPSWMTAVGHWTPNGWALEQLKSILLERVDLLRLVMALVALLLVSLVLFLVGERLLRGRFVQGV